MLTIITNIYTAIKAKLAAILSAYPKVTSGVVTTLAVCAVIFLIHIVMKGSIIIGGAVVLLGLIYWVVKNYL
jgi:hypothetical protein